jgi:hypothetical protein
MREKDGRRSIYSCAVSRDAHQGHDLLFFVDGVEVRGLQDGSHAKFMSGFE